MITDILAKNDLQSAQLQKSEQQQRLHHQYHIQQQQQHHHHPSQLRVPFNGQSIDSDDESCEENEDQSYCSNGKHL